MTPMNMPTRYIGSIAWPAFLVAAVLEMLVFAMLDPQHLHRPGGAALPLSATAIYSLGFLLFWAAAACAAAITLWLDRGADAAHG